MNEFLLLAVVILYVAISYRPGNHKPAPPLVQIIHAQRKTWNTASSRGELGRAKALRRTAAMPCWVLGSTFVLLQGVGS
jgi:hypothetical protein